MSERTMRIVFSSGISNLVEKNSSFDSGVLRVAYTGKNRNNSFISKETYERCIQSIYNCPIVCNYDRETDTIGSHDIELVSTDDGGMKIVNVTQPVGVIPESAKYWWEEIEDNSGVHEYLCVDALIWKRQEAYKKSKMMALQTSQWKSPSKKEKWSMECTSSNDLNSQRFACWGQQSPALSQRRWRCSHVTVSNNSLLR